MDSVLAYTALAFAAVAALEGLGLWWQGRTMGALRIERDEARAEAKAQRDAAAAWKDEQAAMKAELADCDARNKRQQLILARYPGAVRDAYDELADEETEP